MKTKILRKTDIVLIAGFIIFAVMFYFIFDLNSRTGDTVVIKLNGKIYEEISLNKPDAVRDIEIYSDDGTLLNIVSIKEGRKALMTYANCPDKLCTHQKLIYENDLIICLPNRVTVEIINNNKLKEYDAVISIKAPF